MLGTNTANLLLNWLLTAGAVTRPTTFYLSLHTADPGATGANELLTSVDASYVRKVATFGTASAEAASTTSSETWTAASNSTTHSITHVGIWDAASAGNFLMGGALAVPETVVANGSFVLSAGRCTASLS
jgi:hypothetical protein